MVSPLAAAFSGLVAGIFTPLLVELFELALSIDDPSGAVSVHGAAGLWGLIAAGMFAPADGPVCGAADRGVDAAGVDAAAGLSVSSG